MFLQKIYIKFLVFSFIAIFFAKAEEFQEIKFNKNDRILILAPHPDDEIIGCAGIIQRAKKLKLDLKIVFLTYGDNNEWSFLVYRKHPVILPSSIKKMGLVRAHEAISAAKLLGVDKKDLIFLGYPDFRTLAIWFKHWKDAPPATGMLSKASFVPYKNAFRPNAPYKGEEILKDLKTIIIEFKPTKIFVSSPADHNPDHRALYLFTVVALWQLKQNPQVYPYLVHFKNWPQPKGYKPNEKIYPPSVLKDKISWRILNLTEKEIQLKKEAIKKHYSQYISSPKYLLSFVRSNELFGDFPIVKLRQKTSYTISSFDSDYFSYFHTELTEDEKLEFVGIQKEYLILENNCLIFKLILNKPIAKKIKISFYAFGFRDDITFEDMPKIHIIFSKKAYRVYDGHKRIKLDKIKVERKNNYEIKIYLPLELLNNPKYILTSSRSIRNLVPLDWVEWRILEVIYD